MRQPFRYQHHPPSQSSGDSEASPSNSHRVSHPWSPKRLETIQQFSVFFHPVAPHTIWADWHSSLFIGTRLFPPWFLVCHCFKCPPCHGKCCSKLGSAELISILGSFTSPIHQLVGKEIVLYKHDGILLTHQRINPELLHCPQEWN